MERLPEPGGAVAKNEQPSPAQVVAKAIERQAEAFSAVMPKGVDADRFGRLVLTAVKATPKLMECFGTTQGQTSVLLSAMQLAALGLEPNTPMQDAWLLPRWNSQTRAVECEASIGYRGLLKLVRRAGGVKEVFAEVVHERDQFTWARGLTSDELRHVPYDGDDEAGHLTHAYAIVRFLNGGTQFIVFNRRQVEKRRAMSESWKNDKARPYSPWFKWDEEMWKKTVLRALTSTLELSAEDARGLALDEQPLAISQEGVIDVAPRPAGELPAAPEPDVEEREPVVGAGSPEAEGEGDPPPPAPVSVDWIERINSIEHGPTKAAAMKAFRAVFGMPPVVPDDQFDDAHGMLADFEDAARKEAGAVEYTDEQLAKMRRGLQAQATKSFPDKATREAQRHALAWVALNGVQKSTNDMTGQELTVVTARLKDVEDGHVAIELRDGVWWAVQGDQSIEVPAEVTA